VEPWRSVADKTYMRFSDGISKHHWRDASRQPVVNRDEFGDHQRCLAVMYHYVRDRDPIAPGGVRGLTCGEFRAQLSRLCSVMEPIDWPTLYAWIRGRAAVPERCFLLTFDDGLADHAESVLPILADFGLRGLFFVPAQVLTRHRLLPAHAVHVLLTHLGRHRFFKELLDHLADHNGGQDWLATLDRTAAEQMYHYEEPSLAHLKFLLTMALPAKVRNAALEALFARHVGSSARWARTWYLGWEQLVEMQSLGHTIGAHGHSHEPYRRLSPCERLEDLVRAAQVLNDGLGPDIRPMSYPYGSYDDETCSFSRQAGFVQGFTTRHDWIRADCDPFRIPRVDTIHVEAALQVEHTCSRA